ncbi:MAG: hypothetical protein IV097_00455 [Burkholderiaceae bacterium]|nr:hypothetical protein [Burkholderiaceae bacterium]
MHICTVIELATKFTTVINSKVIGISRHKDYSLFHFKAHDVKALKLPISKFIFVDAEAEVDEVILADQLKDRGVNYKTAKRDTTVLTDVELAEVSAAIELARAAMAAGLKPKPEADVKPPVEHRPADGLPKVTITPEAAATGLDDLLTQVDAGQAAGQADEGKAAAEGAEVECDEDTETPPADDPLATIKPSRKRKRR